LHGGEIYGEYYLDTGPLGADWKVHASLDHVRASLKDGSSLPLIPPLTVNAGAQASWGRIEAGADLQWADKQTRAGTGQLSTDSYMMTNLRAAVNLATPQAGQAGVQVFLEARNITDEEARIASSVLRNTVPLPGRNYRAGLRITF
jgi:iron complex outermembrane receptor protein